jgi:hypothetical protein
LEIVIGVAEVLEFHGKAIGVVGNSIGLLVLRTALKVVGRWSGSRRAKRSLVTVEASWEASSEPNAGA